jgi:hypothetical protein
VADTAPFAKALAAIGGSAEIVASRDGANLGATPFADLARTQVGPASTKPPPRAARHDRENPVHLRLDRPAQGASSTRTAC